MKMNSDDVFNVLNSYYPASKVELNYNNDYELLLSTMLSAQTTDKRVNDVTKDLYLEYNSLDKLNALSEEKIASIIKPLGFYKTKAKNFKNIVKSLKEINKVPNDREYLESLPGVGRKTTNVVLAQLYNEPCIAVDTHVYRVSKRLGITNDNDDVLTTEKKLEKYFNKEYHNRLNSLIVLFGRYRCKAKNPLCDDCKLKTICKY